MLFVQFSPFIELFRYKVSKPYSLLFSFWFRYRRHKTALPKIISAENIK